jgi:glyoxylase-like metal-dependent hydrolase (beta-lactamase superfamily II)
MEVQRLAEGLWRWTGVHPSWKPEPEYGVPLEVGSVYYEAEDAVVLIDPIVPSEDREQFLEALDRDIERAQRPVAIILTCQWHARSASELKGRYGGAAWLHGEDPGAQLDDATPFAFGERLPGGVEALDGHFHGEALLWIPAHRTLVAGDVLFVTTDGLRVPPDDWLAEKEQGGRIRTSLGFLLKLPVERVLVGHGEPVLANAHAALERALRAPSTA